MKTELRNSSSLLKMVVLFNFALLCWCAIPSGAQEYGNITPPPPRPRRAYSTVDTYLRTHSGGTVQSEAAPVKHRRAYSTGNTYSSSQRPIKHRRTHDSSTSTRHSTPEFWREFVSGEDTIYDAKHRRTNDTQDSSARTTADTDPSQRWNRYVDSQRDASETKPAKHKSSDTLPEKSAVPKSDSAADLSKTQLKKPLGQSTDDSIADTQTSETGPPVKHEASYELTDEMIEDLTTTASVAKIKSHPRKRLAHTGEKFDISEGKLGMIPQPQMPYAPTSIGGFEFVSKTQSK